MLLFEDKAAFERFFSLGVAKSSSVNDSYKKIKVNGKNMTSIDYSKLKCSKNDYIDFIDFLIDFIQRIHGFVFI